MATAVSTASSIHLPFKLIEILYSKNNKLTSEPLNGTIEKLIILKLSLIIFAITHNIIMYTCTILYRICPYIPLVKREGLESDDTGNDCGHENHPHLSRAVCDGVD